MKILILTNNYPVKNALYSGIFIHQQVKALQQLGAECHVLMLHNWFPPFGLHKHHGYWQQGYVLKQQFLEEYEGVKIHSIPMFVRMPARLFKDNYYERAARSLVKYVEGNSILKDAEWMYAHFLTDNGYIGALAKDKLKIKLAAIARGDDVHAWPEQNPSLVNNIRYVFEKADLMLANNKRLADDALKFANKVTPKFKVAYNGINYQDFLRKTNPTTIAQLKQKYNIPEGKKILLCIARGEYLKGWNELLEAISDCRETLADWVLLAVTDNNEGVFSVSVSKKVASLQLEEKVLVRDYIPFNKVKELYYIADAFILPSYNEGISNAVMEALASGLWVIATNVGGHSEIMQHGVSGFLIAPKSKDAIKQSLQYLVANFDSKHEVVSRQAELAMQQLGDYLDNARKLLAFFN